MNRLLLTIALLVGTTPAFATSETHQTVRPGDRIGILLMSDRYSQDSDKAVVDQVRNCLREELRHAGFDAFDAQTTYDDLHRHNQENADFYVEIVASDAEATSHGGADVNVSHVGVELSLVVARVAAAVRLYDGHSLELLHSYDLHHSSRAVLPSQIGIGDHRIFAVLAIPFIHHVQYRAVVRDVARDAANLIREAHE